MTQLTQFGRYLLLKKLATGGMAELFLGKQIGIEGFEKPVVIKRILPHLAENDDFITMFLDEARLAARLNHPRIVQIYDLGKEGEAYYIAMEYVRGQDFRKIIKRAQSLRETVPLNIAVQIVGGVLEGLDHAHRQKDDFGDPLGVVHRDVSPQNILVSYQGDVKLVDFGIAKASTQIYQTRVGILKGKYAYMSPEQAQGRAVDRRSDIFAAGILLFEVTTNRRLFRQASEVDTLRRVIDCVVDPPSSIDPLYPKELESIVLRALQREPADRFEDARQMLLALEAFMSQQGIIGSSARIGEYMHRLFPQDIAGNAAEMRVLMEARPDTPLPGIRLPPPREPTPPPLPVEVEDEPPTRSPSAPGPVPSADDLRLAEPTMLLDDLVEEPAPPARPPPAEPRPAEPLSTELPGSAPQPVAASTPTPTSAAAGEAQPVFEPTPLPGERTRRRTISWVLFLALAIAALVVTWRLLRPPSLPSSRLGAAPGGPGATGPAATPDGGTLGDGGAALAPAGNVRDGGEASQPAPDASVSRRPRRRRSRRRRRRRRRPVDAKARLQVKTTPATRVYAGDRFLGPTPLDLSLPAGSKRLRLRNRSLGIDEVVEVRLRPGRTSTVHRTFGKATIKIRVVPWAVVKLDGRSLGETPLPAQKVYAGAHVLELSNPRLGKKEVIRLRVRKGQTRMVERVWVK